MKQILPILALLSLPLGCSDDAPDVDPRPSEQGDTSPSLDGNSSTDSGVTRDAETIEDDASSPDAAIRIAANISIAAGESRARNASVSSVRWVDGKAPGVDARVAVELLGSSDEAALEVGHVELRPWYVWGDEGRLLCGGAPGSYIFTFESLEVADETIARAAHEGDNRIALSPGGIGTTTITVRGTFEYDKERARGDSPGENQDARCDIIWDAPVPAEVTIEVETLAPSGVTFAVGDPPQKVPEDAEGPMIHEGASRSWWGACPGDFGGPITLVEGRSLEIGYGLRAGADAQSMLAPVNWTRSEAMTIETSERGPDFEVVRNQGARLFLRSVSGAGDASIVSARGSSQPIRVLSRSHVESVEVFFYNGSSRLFVSGDEVFGKINIGQGPFALRDGAQACNRALDLDARSLTPETCSIEESFATRTSYVPTDWAVAFENPGRCAIELSWPETDIKQSYAFTVVAP